MRYSPCGNRTCALLYWFPYCRAHLAADAGDPGSFCSDRRAGCGYFLEGYLHHLDGAALTPWVGCRAVPLAAALLPGVWTALFVYCCSPYALDYLATVPGTLLVPRTGPAGRPTLPPLGSTSWFTATRGCLDVHLDGVRGRTRVGGRGVSDLPWFISFCRYTMRLRTARV